MADIALNMQTDSSKPARACNWCGTDISHRRSNARNCNDECREAHAKFNRYGQGKSTFGPPAPKQCDNCGALYSSFDPKRKYCEAKGPCGQAAYRKSESGIAYFSRDDVRERQRQASRRHAATDHGKNYYAERDALPHNVKRREDYRRSLHGMQVNRENQRNRMGDRALAAILTPMTGA